MRYAFFQGNIFSFLISDFFYRHSVTIKETPPIIRVYDFNSETLLTKNLHTMRLEIKIESWSSLLNNSASILRQRRPRHDSWDHLVSIQLLLDSKNGKDRKRLQNKYLLVMKRGILSMNREQRSVWKTMTWIMKIHQEQAARQTKSTTRQWVY